MIQPRELIKIFLICFSAMVLMTAVIGLIYITNQQNLRQSANDPQIQLSEDIAGILAKGILPNVIAQNFNQIDIKTSLAPFVIIYDLNGNPISSSAQLNSRIPVIPKGVLEHAREWGQNRRTWQPEDDVRIATVTTPFSSSGQSGYVLVGRNMREIEKRELKLCIEAAAVWFASMFFIALIGIISAVLSFRVKNN